jgi:hypothetical protein
MSRSYRKRKREIELHIEKESYGVRERESGRES